MPWIYQDFDADGHIKGYWHSDEFGVVRHAARIHPENLNTDYWGYPALHVYLLALLKGGAFLYYQSTDLLFNHPMPDLELDLSYLFRLGRVLSLLFDLGTIALLFRFGRVVYGARTGLLAAFLLAVSPMNVIHSRYATVDIGLSFLCLAACYFFYRCLQDGSYRNYLLSGLFLGLATAQKYNAFVLAPAFLGIHGLRHGSLYRATRDLKWLLAGLAALVTFLLVNAAAFFHWSDAITQFSVNFHSVVSVPGHKHNPLLGLLHNIGTLTPAFPLLLLGLAGAFVQLKQDLRKGTALLLFPVLFYLLLSGFDIAPYRYFLPLGPFLCLLAAHLLGIGLWRSHSRSHRGLMGALLLVCIVSCSIHTAGALRVFSAPDTREKLEAWITRNVPPGSVLVVEGHGTAGPRLNTAVYTVYDRTNAPTETFATLQDLIDRDIAYFVTTSRYRQEEEQGKLPRPPIVEEVETDPRVHRIHTVTGLENPLFPHRNPTLLIYLIDQAA